MEAASKPLGLPATAPDPTAFAIRNPVQRDIAVNAFLDKINRYPSGARAQFTISFKLVAGRTELREKMAIMGIQVVQTADEHLKCPFFVEHGSESNAGGRITWQVRPSKGETTVDIRKGRRMTEFQDKVSVLVRYSSLLIGALGPVLEIVGPPPTPNPAGPKLPATAAPPFRPPFQAPVQGFTHAGHASPCCQAPPFAFPWQGGPGGGGW